jgi:ribosome-associated heat shock protein Hsp15
MQESKSVRIDKYLWSVRIFKTRSIATDACRKGKVMVNGLQVKPSKMIIAGEIVQVRKPPAIFTYRIIDLVENRTSARFVSNFIEDLTPAEEKEKISVKHSAVSGYREKGTGRPTKKERRDIDRLIDDFNSW